MISTAASSVLPESAAQAEADLPELEEKVTRATSSSPEFAAFVHEEHPFFLSLARKLTREAGFTDPDAAQELVDDALLASCKNLNFSTRSHRECVAYVVRALRTRMIDRLRSNGARELSGMMVEEGQESLIDLIPDRGLSPDCALEEQEARDELGEILSTLPEIRQSGIEGRFLEGQSVRETAALLEVSVPNMRYHLRRGLEELRERLSRKVG